MIKRLIVIILLICILLSASFCIFVYIRSGSLSLSFFEKEPPFVTAPLSIGLGIETKDIQINIKDNGAGLDEVIVKLDVDGKIHEITKKRYPVKTPVDTFTISLNSKELGLKEGKAILHISAFDRSFYVNGSEKEIPVVIKFNKPKGELLTPQHNVALGGVELVFYKVKNVENGYTGVQVGNNFFKGFQAALLDDRFAKYPEVYFTFFAVPYNFNKITDKIFLSIKDSVGNSISIPIPYLLIPRKFTTVEMKLSDTFLQKVADELIQPYLEVSGVKLPFDSNDISKLSSEEKRSLFKSINEDYRAILAKKLTDIFNKSESSRLWDWTWNRPMKAAPTSNFCETRNYTYDGQQASQSLHAGVDLADTSNAQVHAANRGKVLFADFLGIYGNAVIIDHGFGFSTLYGHLSSISVNVGDEVAQDAVIGRSGTTGLAGGDHLHFEIRLGGISIHPIEWWDTSWVKEHIQRKIDWVGKSLDTAEIN